MSLLLSILIGSVITLIFDSFLFGSKLKEICEKRLVAREKRLYRQSLEAAREQDSHLFDGSSLVIRGLFYMDNLLMRRCPDRKEHYLNPLRQYRLFTLNWSDKRAACEARIGKRTYIRIEGLSFKERPQKETIAHICAAFGVDADRLGFDKFYLEEELTTINLKARRLRLEWADGESKQGALLVELNNDTQSAITGIRSHSE